MVRRQRPNIWAGLWGDFQWLVLGNRDRRLPSVLDQVDWFVGELWRGLLTGPDAGPETLPANFPEAIYRTVENIVIARGGWADRETERPNFWLKRSKCSVTPFSYVLPVGYELTADPAAVTKWETVLEDRLHSAGYSLNVRIALRPLRIEIDQAKTPVMRLADHWASIGQLPTDQAEMIPGMILDGGKMLPMRYAMTNDRLSNLVAGSPGSGKTQLTLGMILTLCYQNSPQNIALLIIDPKVMDWLPLQTLPHLAAPIANEPEIAVGLINAMVEEMERRKKLAKQGVTAADMKTIVLYIDEIADLLDSLPSAQAAQVENGIKRLSQTGRGLKLGVIGATQRVYDIPAPLYSKLNSRFVGKTANAQDGAAASGVAGVTTHKLPGRGAFEFYPGGQRLQGWFVADPDDDKTDYAQVLGKFADDINRRWAGQRPHWQPGPGVFAVAVDGQETATEAAQGQAEGPQVDPFLDRALDAYLADPDGFTKRALRRLHETETGRGISGDTAAQLWDRLMAYGRQKYNAM